MGLEKAETFAASFLKLFAKIMQPVPPKLTTEEATISEMDVEEKEKEEEEEEEEAELIPVISKGTRSIQRKRAEGLNLDDSEIRPPAEKRAGEGIDEGPAERSNKVR